VEEQRGAVLAERASNAGEYEDFLKQGAVEGNSLQIKLSETKYCMGGAI
jgi:hypothetical protein